MLTLNEAQWRALQAHDNRQFVLNVVDQFLANRPDMRETPGKYGVAERIQAAHEYGTRIGFTSTPHMVRLMYLAADAPRIHDDPVVHHHLSKPGATPEQRLDDLLAVMNKKLEETS
ncbi:hypothetical protein [Aquabacterium parvum]|uniref:hypothetical protein n=1 Tax=Aquabacterium parvum TaxID=70584 RepID=UPI000718F64F|nr:hypothetical protein [Aquabacterium parvum]MBU0914889.1 hypothetical protein [Gammaproteobacteria bacterium]